MHLPRDRQVQALGGPAGSARSTSCDRRRLVPNLLIAAKQSASIVLEATWVAPARDGKRPRTAQHHYTLRDSPEDLLRIRSAPDPLGNRGTPPIKTAAFRWEISRILDGVFVAQRDDPPGVRFPL